MLTRLDSLLLGVIDRVLDKGVGFTARAEVEEKLRRVRIRPSARAGRQIQARSLIVRVAYSALMTLLMIGALPSVSFGQIVISADPSHWNRVDRRDHAVLVATVTRLGDPIVLPTLQQGDGFVLGAASLNLKNPDRPTVVFAITNGSNAPIPLSRVGVWEATVDSGRGDGRVVVSCGWGPRLSREEAALQRGATVTVEMPVAPHCKPDLGETIGFLVYLQGDGKMLGLYQTEALLRNAFNTLISVTQQ